MTTKYRVAMVKFMTSQAWGGQLGREAFSKLASHLAERSEPLIELDLAGVARLDVSCSREILANIVERHRGTKWFFLSHVANPSVRENIDAAFLRKEMSVLSRHPDGEYEVLGCALKPHLAQTLEVVENKGEATSKMVCSIIKDLALTACNNRLKDLSDLGLVARVEGAAETGGKEFSYRALR